MFPAALALVGGIALTLWLSRAYRYDSLIHHASREYGVDPALIAAVVWKESRFNPRAVGGVGEIGLMQVTEMVGIEWAAAHGQEPFTRDDLFDPATNLRAGTWYLGLALGHWSDRPDPIPYALAQYNAGRSNALRWARGDDGDPQRFLDQITYPGTRAYIDAIMARHRRRTRSR
jgi:soluble lytic murein transglycosylase